jgi:hypothetical protein
MGRVLRIGTIDTKMKNVPASYAIGKILLSMDRASPVTENFSCEVNG